MSLHKRYKSNNRGKDYVIGDLHGMYRLLFEKLKEIKFNPEMDRVFSVGDLIDRGPDSKKCAELIYEPWFHTVRGNHEDMMIKSLVDKDVNWKDTWVMNGGLWAASRS